MKRIIAKLALVAFTAVAVFTACGGGSKEEPDVPKGLDVSVITSPVNAKIGDDVSWTVLQLKSPVVGDIVRFSKDSKSFDCRVKSVQTGKFSFTIVEGMQSGVYTVKIVRGEASVGLGTVSVTIEAAQTVVPETGSTVYGLVHSNGKGIEGVVVSDGYLTAVTNKDGVYQLASEKKNAYVFISVPSGYEVPSDGFQAKFWSKTTKAATVAERIDFSLTKVDQTNFSLIVLGDLHLANRNSDRAQFAKCTDDINAYLSANSGKKVYALTLGDMTWDLYWYNNGYFFPQYIQDMNSHFSNLKFYHTIGNHDHDMNATGDWNTVAQYKSYIGPNYYSVNIGGIHLMSIDNIECTNASASTTDGKVRAYNEKVVSDVINWMKKDLSYVSKSTPIYISSHASFYSTSTATTFSKSLKNFDEVAACLSGYTTHILTGHTHKIYNVDMLKASTPHFEHNCGAVCATWWWTAKYTNSSDPTKGIHVAQDGAIGGYYVFDFAGTNVKWQYHPTGLDVKRQFNSYDLNMVDLSKETNIPADYISSNSFGTSSDNKVLINVWNYDPSWTVEVKEGTKSLAVTRVKSYDPLFLLAYTAKGGTSFSPYASNHLFTVQASSATSTLEIKVTDRFGNVYTESMARPKTFSVAEYNK